jgi:hypothetical protein
MTIRNTFLVASENGFVLSRRGAAVESGFKKEKGVQSEREEHWTCTVPGCVANVEL